MALFASVSFDWNISQSTDKNQQNWNMHGSKISKCRLQTEANPTTCETGTNKKTWPPCSCDCDHFKTDYWCCINAFWSQNCICDGRRCFSIYAVVNLINICVVSLVPLWESREVQPWHPKTGFDPRWAQLSRSVSTANQSDRLVVHLCI